jgi:tetratricopeptide (TPR) repeat protein
VASIERVVYLHQLFCRCLEESKDLDRDAEAAIRQAANPPPGMDYVRQRYNDEADACERRSREVYSEGMDARRQIDREIELLVAGTPANVSALFNLGRQLGNVGPGYESLPFKKALQIGPASSEDVIALAGVLSSHGRSGEFAARLNRRALPDADAALRVAGELERLAMPDLALTILDWGWEQWHDRRLSAQERVLLIRQGQAARAILSLESELAGSPGDPTLEAELSAIYESTKNWPKLVQWLAQKRGRAPKDRALWDEQKARLRRLGLQAELIKLLEEQTALEPADGALEEELWVAMATANDLARLRRRLAQNSPMKAIPLRRRKLYGLLRSLGAKEDLIALLQQEFAVGTPDAEVVRELCALLETSARWGQLAEVLAQLRRREPNDLALRERYRVAIGRAGDRQALAGLLQEDLSLDPRNQTLRSKTVESLVSAGRLRDATTTLEEGLRLYPGNSAWQRQLARLLIQTHREDEALRFIESTLDAADRPLLHHFATDILAAKGAPEVAGRLCKMKGAVLQERVVACRVVVQHCRTSEQIGPALTLFGELISADAREAVWSTEFLTYLLDSLKSTPAVVWQPAATALKALPPEQVLPELEGHAERHETSTVASLRILDLIEQIERGRRHRVLEDWLTSGKPETCVLAARLLGETEGTAALPLIAARWTSGRGSGIRKGLAAELRTLDPDPRSLRDLVKRRRPWAYPPRVVSQLGSWFRRLGFWLQDWWATHGPRPGCMVTVLLGVIVIVVLAILTPRDTEESVQNQATSQAAAPTVTLTATVAASPTPTASMTATQTPTPTTTPERIVASQPVAIVKVDAVNVRSGPTTNGAIVGTSVNRESLPVKGRNSAGDWVQVVLANQRIGWIRADLIDLTVPIGDLPLIP